MSWVELLEEERAKKARPASAPPARAKSERPGGRSTERPPSARAQSTRPRAMDESPSPKSKKPIRREED